MVEDDSYHLVETVAERLAEELLEEPRRVVGEGQGGQATAARRGGGPLQRHRGAAAHVSATIIDGSAIAKAIRAEIAAEVTAMVAEGLAVPHLGVVLCGDDPASATYVRNKGRAAERAGIRFSLHTPGGGSSTSDILDLCARMRDDPDIDAMLVQLPLPRQIDSGAVLEAVPAAKDADGFHPLNLGRLAAGGCPRCCPGPRSAAWSCSGGPGCPSPGAAPWWWAGA